MRCLSKELPAAVHALASHWPPVNPQIMGRISRRRRLASGGDFLGLGHHHHHHRPPPSSSSSGTALGSEHGHPSLGAHRFVVMNQPIRNTRLRDRVSAYNMQRGAEAVNAAIESVNFGPFGRRGSSSSGGNATTTQSPGRQHLFGHLIDFLGLLAPT